MAKRPAEVLGRLAPYGLVLLAILAAGAAVAQETPAADDLPGLLLKVGLKPGDLDLVTTPDWLGHPAPGSVPFLLPHWEPATRDPRRLLALGSNLLHVGSRTAAAEPADGSPSLLKLFTSYALLPRLPGFRGQPPPIRELPAGAGALTAVLDALRLPATAGDAESAIDPRRPLFDGPLPAAGAEELALTPALRRPLARLLAGLRQAGRAVERSWRGVAPAVVERAVRTPDVPRLLPGGSVDWPALADAARSGGDVERAGAALTALAALERFVAELGDVAGEDLASLELWSAPTPWGRVIVAGEGPHRHLCAEDCLLIVDLGGDDEYAGTAAAAVAPRTPVAAVVDLAGNDRYQTANGPAQGAGLGGVGMLFDLVGDDLYEAADGAQGFGLLGYGLLWDAAGEDRFSAGGGAQGAAVFGAGVLVSGDGRDEYRLLGEGQGFGGPGGAGALVDLAGDDRYFAEPDPARAPGRADVHSRNRVNASNAQGAGVGRRGDLSDGRVWAGGLGVLADLGGSDRYTAGNFAQGMGYFFGTGLLLDSGGDDEYRSVYFSQGSGAHFSLALLYDLAGDDRHILDREAAASLGYSWDFASSLFVDAGGHDLYRARDTALGVAERSSVALFLELGGDDAYELPAGARAFGAVDNHPRAYSPGGPLHAAALAPNVGLFADLGGVDRYPAATLCGATPGDGKQWTCVQSHSRPAAPHVGAGIDADPPPPTDVVEWLGFGSKGK